MSRPRTISEQTPNHMMDLRITSRILSQLRTPRQHLIDKLLPRRLVPWECAQQAQQLALARRIGLHLAFAEHIEQEYTKISAGAALSGF
jgi:hypothetical protein